MRRPAKKFAVVTAAGVIAIATAGGAYAFWNSTGNGPGSATTGTSSAWTVTTGSATGGDLTPGGPTDTIAVHVMNPSTGVQHLNAVTAVVANSGGGAWAPGVNCSASDYTVSAVTIATGDVTPGATVDGSVTITMKNLGSNQDGCKLLTVPLYVSAS
jgi:hypothetical protein